MFPDPSPYQLIALLLFGTSLPVAGLVIGPLLFYSRKDRVTRFFAVSLMAASALLLGGGLALLAAYYLSPFEAVECVPVREWARPAAFSSPAFWPGFGAPGP